jgi:hypothetical protein
MIIGLYFVQFESYIYLKITKFSDVNPFLFISSFHHQWRARDLENQDADESAPIALNSRLQLNTLISDSQSAHKI